jgi:hypothetical protein
MDRAREAPEHEKLLIGPVSGHGFAELRLPGITWVLHIFNEDGGLLQSVVPTAGTAVLDLSSLPTGSYEVMAVGPLGTTLSGIIIKG